MKNKPEKTEEIIARALEAKRKAARTVTAHRNLALSLLSEAISKSAAKITRASDEDVAAARKGGMSEEEAEKLRLDYIAVGAISGMVLNLSACDDPTDKTEHWKRDGGLDISTVRIPLGVVFALCDGNPKRAFEVAAMCIKTGNVLLLMRSDKTPRTDAVFSELIGNAFSCCGIEPDSVISIKYEQKTLDALLRCTREIDAVLLMGGKNLNSYVRANTKIPIIESSMGAVHIYVDEGADIVRAADGIIKSKLSGLTSAVNTVLVNWMASDDFLPVFEGRAMAAGIELCGDARIKSTLHGISDITKKDLSDAGRQKIALVTVNSVSDALEHIKKYGDGICETIYSENDENIAHFVKSADAGAVTVNASPACANGYDIGFGGDLGISADKLRSRGPLGIYRLTTTKYIIKG